MKKFLFVITGIMVLSLAVSGCVSISKYTPPANEEEKPVFKAGGTGKEQPKVKIEVELLEKPDLSKFSAPRTPDTDVSGNRGNLPGGLLSAKGSMPAQASAGQPKAWWATMPEEPVKTITEELPQAVEPVMTKYKVKKGQTLADVSKEVYGTTKKWKKIYNANKEKIKNPDKIYAGQVLNIPQEESQGTGAVKHLK